MQSAYFTASFVSVQI